MTAKLPIFIILVFLFTGCFSTIKPSKQIDDNQKIIAKEEKKVDNTLVEIEKNDKGKKIQQLAKATTSFPLKSFLNLNLFSMNQYDNHAGPSDASPISNSTYCVVG